MKLNLILYFFFFTFHISAQTLDSTAYKQFKFIKREKNKIENDSSQLNLFYEKLYQLQKTKKGKINIVHIGDSHIQADNLSGTVRQKMQLKFGNAGRGLIFPYRLAKSNEPVSYKTTTNVKWDSKRNVFYEKPLPIGISGFTIETNDSSAEINLTVKDQPGLGYSFTKFSLFHEKGLGSFDITICDNENCEKGIFKSNDSLNNPFVSRLELDKPINQIILRNKRSDTINNKTTRIYGMLLENDSSGILYNMIGVNGAEYKHYNMSKFFLKQLPFLNPDLIIISLGTNEAYSKGFEKILFYNQIDTLINSIKFTNPQASILLTTPSDSFRRTRKGKIKNPDVETAEKTISEYCKRNNLACWDLFEIMGGYGSMAKWYTAKLSAKDKVHFAAKGYQIQGDLFYNALIKGYENFIQNKINNK